MKSKYLTIFLMLLGLTAIFFYNYNQIEANKYIGSSLQRYTNYNLGNYGSAIPLDSMDSGNTSNLEILDKKATWLQSEEEFKKRYKENNRNAPIDLITKRIKFSSTSGCINFPEITHLQFSNIYWQTFITSEKASSVFLYGAYYDNRILVENAPVIRIIAVIRVEDIPSMKYCQIWFPDEKKVVISNRTSAIHSDPWNYHTHSYIFSCEIPPEYKDKVPAAVSIVEEECDKATNVLTVHYNKPESGEKEDFAICSKGIFYPESDLSFYFVQYIELAKIMGVSKLYFYEYMLNPNMSAVMRYYENQDRVQLTQITIPGYKPNLPGVMLPLLKMRAKNDILYQRAVHNDCFYRNIHRYKYIAFIDPDEIMVPSNGKSWKDVIDNVIKTEKDKQGDLYTPPSTYHIPMGLFRSVLRKEWTPGIPQYMSMLQNVNRTDFVGYFKQIVDTERNYGCSNHMQTPAVCIGKCIIHQLNVTDTFLSHYREKNCRTKVPCNTVVTDTRIWNYKDDMIKNVNGALKDIGLL